MFFFFLWVLRIFFLLGKLINCVVIEWGLFCLFYLFLWMLLNFVFIFKCFLINVGILINRFFLLFLVRLWMSMLCFIDFDLRLMMLFWFCVIFWFRLMIMDFRNWIFFWRWEFFVCKVFNLLVFLLLFCVRYVILLWKLFCLYRLFWICIIFWVREVVMSFSGFVLLWLYLVVLLLILLVRFFCWFYLSMILFFKGFCLFWCFESELFLWFVYCI